MLEEKEERLDLLDLPADEKDDEKRMRRNDLLNLPAEENEDEEKRMRRRAKWTKRSTKTRDIRKS